MPINPITLDKYEPNIIKQIEHKVIDRIVHETKNSQPSREDGNKNNFNGQKQEQAAKQLGQYLAKFNIKLEYKIFKKKVKIKLRDKDGNLILETDIDDIEGLFESVRKETGNIIDVRG